MASIPKNQAYEESQDALNIITSVANQSFIEEADAAIQQAISRGEFFVSLVASKEVSPKDISDYYSNLGYSVGFSNFTQNGLHNPSRLFGQAWQDYWNGGIIPKKMNKPFRVVIKFS